MSAKRVVLVSASLALASFVALLRMADDRAHWQGRVGAEGLAREALELRLSALEAGRQDEASAAAVRELELTQELDAARARTDRKAHCGAELAEARQGLKDAQAALAAAEVPGFHIAINPTYERHLDPGVGEEALTVLWSEGGYATGGVRRSMPGTKADVPVGRPTPAVAGNERVHLLADEHRLNQGVDYVDPADADQLAIALVEKFYRTLETDVKPIKRPPVIDPASSNPR